MSTVGDQIWKGVDEYNDPENLDVGFFSYGENTRVDQQQITGRGGHVPVTWGQSSYSATPTPLGACYAGIEYIDSATKRNRMLSFGASGAWLTEVSGGTIFVPYPTGETMTSTKYQLLPNTTGSQSYLTGTFAIKSNPFPVQALNVVYLFRGDGIIPLQFPDHNGGLNFEEVYTDTNSPVAGGYLRMPWGNSAVWTSQNRFAVLMGDALYPSLVASLSTPLPIEYYDPAKVIPITQGSGDLSTGVVEYDQSTLLITKQKSARLISGFTGDLSGVTVSPIVGCTGCVAPRAIFALGGSISNNSQSANLYIPNSDGIYSVMRVFQTQIQSIATDFALNVRKSYQLANWNSFTGAVSAQFEGLIYLAIPTGTSTVNDRVLVYSTVTNAWVGSDTFDPQYAPVAFLVLKENNKPRLFALSSTGLLYRYAYNTANIQDGLGTDAATSYPMVAVTRGYTSGYSTPTLSAYKYQDSPRVSFAQGSLILPSFNAQYTVTLIGSTVGKTIPLRVQGNSLTGSRDRLKYTVAGKAPWVPTNANHDAENPYREDYSLCLGNSPFIVDNITGNHLFQYQEGRVNFTGIGRGRYFQVQVVNSKGQVRLHTLDSGIEDTSDVKSSGKQTE